MLTDPADPVPGSASLRRLETTVLAAGHATAARVSILDAGGGRVVVFKDYSQTSGIFRRFIAPLLAWREVTALRRLGGIDGIPQLIRPIGQTGLLMEYVPAEALPNAGDVGIETLDALEILVANMHAAGVAHADLRAARNVLVDEVGRPYIVDFVARVQRGASWNRPWNRLFELFKAADYSAIAKLRLRYAPAHARTEDPQLARHTGRQARIGRAIGMTTRRVVQRFAHWQ